MTAEGERVRRRDEIDASTDATDAYVQRLLAETPPLTTEERRDLTRLLTAPDRGDDDAAA